MHIASASHFGIDIAAIRSDLATQADTERVQLALPVTPAVHAGMAPLSRAAFDSKILKIKSAIRPVVGDQAAQTSPPAHVAIDMSTVAPTSSTDHCSAMHLVPPPAGAQSMAGAALQTDVLRGTISTCAQTALVVTTFAIPPAALLAGIGLLADGIRRRVQSGGFAHSHCQNDEYDDDVTCDHGRKPTDPWYDPSDHRSRTALGEIIAGSVMTGTGGIITATYACFFRK